MKVVQTSERGTGRTGEKEIRMVHEDRSVGRSRSDPVYLETKLVIKRLYKLR